MPGYVYFKMQITPIILSIKTFYIVLIALYIKRQFSFVKTFLEDLVIFGIHFGRHRVFV